MSRAQGQLVERVGCTAKLNRDDGLLRHKLVEE
jgi:hypothetical protein